VTSRSPAADQSTSAIGAFSFSSSCVSPFKRVGTSEHETSKRYPTREEKAPSLVPASPSTKTRVSRVARMSTLPSARPIASFAGVSFLASPRLQRATRGAATLSSIRSPRRTGDFAIRGVAFSEPAEKAFATSAGANPYLVRAEAGECRPASRLGSSDAENEMDADGDGSGAPSKGSGARLSFPPDASFSAKRNVE
jgi:hypothetical protein